jgi:endo-1,4-beta-xylanase
LHFHIYKNLIIMTKKIILPVLLCIGLIGTKLHSQNIPITIQAESGSAGSDYAVGTDGDVTYLYPQTDLLNSNYPDSSIKILTFQVTFADSGTYKLFGRIRVGSGNASDDSFFYGNGFGNKDTDNADDWIRCNNVNVAGYTIVDDIVQDRGSAAMNVWKWLNLSDFTGDEAPMTFRVEQDALTQTFQYGSRENGLDLDKIAFGRAGIYYSVDNLNKGEAGSLFLPGEEPVGPPLAYGLDKFLGCAYGPDSQEDFAGYWNQVTPGNGGKWGWVEGTRDVMSWNDLDEAYQVAMDSNYFYRHHVLVWGNQQPAWIETLDSAEQHAEIEEWFAAVAERYPDISQVEVVNEPLHDPPNLPGNGGGNYIQALGGAGVTGWDWIIEAFRMARAAFGSETNLYINEYGIMNSAENTDAYREIIDLLIDEDTLINGIGLQAHGFSHNTSVAVIQRNLDTLAATGLPLYITELDVDGLTDKQQVNTYMKIFPVFWEHPSVQGITLWGFRPGMWRTEQGAYLITAEGVERPAMLWLRAYLKGEFVANSSINVNSQSGESTINSMAGTLQMLAEVLPEDATLKTVHWMVNNTNIATINTDGLLTAKANGVVTVTALTLEYGSTVSGTMDITISGQENSVESIAGTENITLFPNPVIEGHFTLQGLENISEVAVLTLNGNLITSVNAENQTSADIYLDVPAGMYIVRLSDGVRFWHTKIVVRK